ncbi:hypothetical protein R50073_01280 [Maricurvus nonylphenolicus]
MDANRAVDMLDYALDYFTDQNILPFNVSLHGGEVTSLPKKTLEALLVRIQKYYSYFQHDIESYGFKKSNPHIKTNLYNFHKYRNLLENYKVSISASVDLPFSLHEKYRTTKQGLSSLERVIKNLRLLSDYPYRKKLSATLFNEHVRNTPQIIDDIWFIHNEIGFDMNNFNFMFGFDSMFNNDKFQGGEHMDTSPVSDNQQAMFYQEMKDAFSETELEAGLKKYWFEEFTPAFCTNAVNCGEKFILLQSNGDVYSCVRGQGEKKFFYGNIQKVPAKTILANARSNISLVHQQEGFHPDCQKCEYLHVCHTGCAFVKYQRQNGKSYTCALQKAIYRDDPKRYKATSSPESQALMLKDYSIKAHPKLILESVKNWLPNNDACEEKVMTLQENLQTSSRARIVLPNDLYQDKNSLSEIIEKDDVLKALYSSKVIRLVINKEEEAVESQILKQSRSVYYLCDVDEVGVFVKASLFENNCSEKIRNSLYLQMLRDTHVVYGDEERIKQEHIFNYQIFYNQLKPIQRDGDQWFYINLSPILRVHSHLFLNDVLNNLFITTQAIREYHYKKQKNNAFYHIQAVNLPFQNVEFYWT